MYRNRHASCVVGPAAGGFRHFLHLPHPGLRHDYAQTLVSLPLGRLYALGLSTLIAVSSGYLIAAARARPKQACRCHGEPRSWVVVVPNFLVRDDPRADSCDQSALVFPPVALLAGIQALLTGPEWRPCRHRTSPSPQAAILAAGHAVLTALMSCGEVYMRTAPRQGLTERARRLASRCWPNALIPVLPRSSACQFSRFLAWLGRSS